MRCHTEVTSFLVANIFPVFLIIGAIVVGADLRDAPTQVSFSAELRRNANGCLAPRYSLEAYLLEVETKTRINRFA